MKRTTPIVLSVLFTMIPCLVHGEWHFEGATGALYDSNLSNSDRAADVKEDWAWSTDVSIGNAFQLSRDLRLNLGTDLHGQLWDEYGGFNEIGGGPSSSLRYRFGLGRQAPWILVENRISYDGFQESMRSGWNESFGFRSGFAISARIAVEAGYTFENFAAADDFFDLQSHSGNIRVIVDLTSSLQIAVGYRYREGDVISYAVPPRRDILMLASDFQPVTTFGTDPLYVAYKLLGRTHSISVSAGYAIMKYLSIQAAYEYSVTSHDPLQYENHFVDAKIALSY
jgi:hypothetical protein